MLRAEAALGSALASSLAVRACVSRAALAASLSCICELRTAARRARTQARADDPSASRSGDAAHSSGALRRLARRRSRRRRRTRAPPPPAPPSPPPRAPPPRARLEQRRLRLLPRARVLARSPQPVELKAESELLRKLFRLVRPATPAAVELRQLRSDRRELRLVPRLVPRHARAHLNGAAHIHATPRGGALCGECVLEEGHLRARLAQRALHRRRARLCAVEPLSQCADLVARAVALGLRALE